jgi:hypothetical protein
MYSVSEKLFFSFSGYMHLLLEDTGKYKQSVSLLQYNHIKLIEAHKYEGKIVPVNAVRYVERREVEQYSFLNLALDVYGQLQ